MSDLVLAWTYRDIDDGRARQRGQVELDLATNPSPSVQATGIAGRGRDQVWLQRPLSIEDLMHPSVRLATAAGGENWTGAGTYDLAAQPCPAIMAHGVAGAAKHQYWIERGDGDPRQNMDHRAAQVAALQAPTPDPDRPDLASLEADTQERHDVSTETGKPPYDPPTMDEVRAVPWNGLNVVTTFAGGGGSSTGYRMAGYRVLAAVEFVPAAQETYAANMASYTHLFRRDVRDVTAADILKATGLKAGQLDVFDGSPPCEPFSSAGQRDKKWGQVNPYSGQMQRSDDLFFVYAHLLAGLQPKVFVAENVAGLVRGRAKGYFKMIHKALEDAGYMVRASLVDAQWLGVPQTRQRLIFVGVRNDLAARGLAPVFPKPLPYRYTVRDALPWIFRHGTDPNFDRRRAESMSTDDMMVESDTRPAGAIRTTSGGLITDVGRTGAGGLVDADPGSGDRTVYDDQHGRSRRAGKARKITDTTDQPHPTVVASDSHSAKTAVERDVDLAELVAGDRAVHDVDHGQHVSQGDVTDRPAPTIQARHQSANDVHVERDADLAELVAGDRAVHDQETGRTPGNPNGRALVDVTDRTAPTVTAGSQSAPQSRRLVVERDVDMAELVAGERAVHDARGQRKPVDATDRPSPTVVTAQHHSIERDVDHVDLLVGDRAVAGSFEQFVEQRDVTDEPVPAILAGQQGHQGIERDLPPETTIPDQGARQRAAATNGWRIVQLADGRVVERRKFTIPELKAISGFPPDYDIRGSFSVQWERLGDTHAPLQVFHIGRVIADEILIPARRYDRRKPHDITKHINKLVPVRERLEQEAATA